MLKQQHQLFVGLLCVVDAAMVVVACLVAWAVRRLAIEGWFPRSWETYLREPLFVFLVPAAVYAIWFFGLYRPRRDRSLVNEQLQLLKASTASVVVLVVFLWAVGSNVIIREPATPAQLLDPKFRTVGVLGMPLDAGKVQIGSLIVLLPLALGLHRAAFRLGLRGLRRRGWNQRHVAIIGCGRLGQIVARTLERNTWTGLRVAYFISHNEQPRQGQCLAWPVRGGLADLERTLDEHKPDAVYLALPAGRFGQLQDLLARLEKFAVDVRIVPDVSPRYLPQSMAISELDGMPILSYRECPTAGLGGLSKRALDIVGSAACLVLFAPLIALVAVLVRLSGPGPVIFKQRRVSLGGQTFKIYKFRTMHYVRDELGPGAAPGWTERNDARITGLGRVLRRTSLDELPQLLNVLKGDMSLVGPRPERPELIRRFREDWRGYMLRQHVKAGITGWAQVNGLRGQTSLRKRLQYDLFYIKNWSLGFDLRILVLTLFRGFVHRNAH
ncbi:MAG TPA: undecaprenyl-phosphate glucose phosphotransferase [Phycisphaerales bacterium]|nr:undecaprenyl-phosphate glucose phosphotransferase [Phycisphaerales bacterium]